MAYLYTGSSSQAATNTGLSTQILVKIGSVSIGAIQNLSEKQARPLKAISEIGTDGNIEIVPNGPTSFNLTVQRIHFDRKSITEALGRAFINIQAQRIPFDIAIYDFHNVPAGQLTDDFDVSGVEGVITTIYENCWIASKSTEYNASDYIIMQNVDIQAEFCHTFINGDPLQSAVIAVPERDDAVERVADTGRRGSLDARGLARLGDIFGDLLEQ